MAQFLAVKPHESVTTGIVVSALPSFLTFGLFYSLAVHMRQSLGAWLSSIGECGFPPLLVTHAAVTVNFFRRPIAIHHFYRTCGYCRVSFR
jgi:hypothetical protein